MMRTMDPSLPVISSASNLRVKGALALRDRRARDETGLTIVDGAREVRRSATVSDTTIATIRRAATTVTGPSPRPSPVRSAGLPSQSAIEAPSGRVSTYAPQNATTGLRRKRHQAIAGTAIIAAYSTADGRKPSPSAIADRSPTAVPSANVTSTAAQ